MLAWAIVFADLGTSVFYVPAILDRWALAPWFVLVVAVAFVFVALGHLEIAHRYPRGAVASRPQPRPSVHAWASCPGRSW